MKTKNKTYQTRRNAGLCAMCGKVESVRFRSEQSQDLAGENRASEFRSISSGAHYRWAWTESRNATRRIAGIGETNGVEN